MDYIYNNNIRINIQSRFEGRGTLQQVSDLPWPVAHFGVGKTISDKINKKFNSVCKENMNPKNCAQKQL